MPTSPRSRFTRAWATGTAFVAYRADGSRHFVFNIKNSAAGSLEIGHAAQTLLAGADHFHVMGSSPVFRKRRSLLFLQASRRSSAKAALFPSTRIYEKR